MSALTKIAVVLLVVTSLLLSAGVVVFVNKVEDFRRSDEARSAELSKEKSLHNDTKAILAAAQDSATAVDSQLKGQIAQLGSTISERQKEIAGLQQQIATLTGQLTTEKANMAVATQTQAGLQQQLAGMQTQVAELRGIRDKLVEERHKLNVDLTDALSKLEATERARQRAAENAGRAGAELNDLQRKLEGAGIALNAIPKRIAEGTPSLEGVVNSVFVAGGKPWASISIGSKDNVTKDMKFNVVSDNEFLGYLIIQSTEPNEAIGVLDGPKVEKVRTGNQVKTQLQ